MRRRMDSRQTPQINRTIGACGGEANYLTEAKFCLGCGNRWTEFILFLVVHFFREMRGGICIVQIRKRKKGMGRREGRATDIGRKEHD